MNTKRIVSHQYPHVTVITITRKRLTTLSRAIASVESQDYQGQLSHLILVDDCYETKLFLEEIQHYKPNLKFLYSTRTSEEKSGPVRLARLRNQSIFEVISPWVCFLDDDNEFEQNHISSLMSCAITTGKQAIYCHRRIYNFDGTPFLEQYWPWSRTIADGLHKYKQFCNLGMIEPGSNIFRDRIDLTFGSYVMQVDTNVWLLDTELLRKYPIPEIFTKHDWEQNLAEDDKMLENFVKSGIDMICNNQTTVRYYLGGYSNDFDANHQSDIWEL
jgi:glycosyltransferase involved in cell wall biosynthesis